MAHTIKLKRTSTAGNKPTSTNITTGELALNTADKSLYIQTGTANTDIVTLYDDGILHLDDGNNRVGIGTTSPGTELEIAGPNPILRIREDDQTNRFGDILVNSGRIRIRSRNGSNNGVIAFEGNNGSTTEYARFNPSGYLGIGETDPSAPLHIGGDGRVAIFGDDSFDDKYIELREGGTTGFRMGLRTNLVDSSGCILLQTGDDKGFGIAVNTTAAWGSVATSSIPFYVAEGGSVGIGTTSPTYHFHVDAGNNSTTALFESDGVANVVVSGGTNRGSFVVQHSGTTSGALIAKSGGGLEFGVGANYATNVRMVLDSNGAVTFNDAFTFPTAIGSPGQVLKVPTSGTTLYWEDESAASTSTSIADADGDTKIQVEKSSDEDKIRFDTAGTERVIIDDTGKVGIGTSLPEGIMHFSASSDYDIVFDNTSQEKFKLRHGTSGIYLTGPDTNTLAFGVDQSHDVKMFSTSGSAYATFDGSTSRVGIGTATPSQMLHVHGGAVRATGASADDSLVLQLGQMETSGNPMWSIYSDDVGTDKLEFTTTRWGASYYWTRGSAAGSRVNMMQLNRLSTGDKHWSELSLWTQADASATGSTTTTKDIAFNAGSSSYINGGNLGIGTTSPNRQLHISGSGSTVAAKIEATDGNQASVDIKNSEGEFRIINDGGELSIYDQTDTTERFRIDTAGFVGIGTNNPLYQLDVHTTTGTGLNVTDDNGWATIRVDGGGGTDNVLELANFGNAGSGSLIRTTGTGHLRLFSGNTEAIRIDGTTQNVGVGETTPNAALHVTTGTDADGIIIQRNSTTGGTSAQLGFMPSTNSSGTPNLWIKGIRGAGSYNDNYMTFGTNSLERMRINAVGNIGIGTTSPSQKLQVAGTILADTALAASSGDTSVGIGAESSINDSSSTYKTKLITDNNNAKLTTYQYSSYLTLKAGVEASGYANNWSKIELRDGGGTGSNNAHMKFYTHGDERMIINNGGNVGIGTSSPTSELQVGDGTTNATIKAYYSDNTYAELAGYGVQFNRSTSYLRPTTNGDKQLEIGGSSLNWNKIINWADTSFLFSGGGNVGIGSSDPQAVLDLGNATNGRGIAWGGGSGTSHYNTIWSEYSTASIIIGAGLKGATNSATFLNPFTGTYGYAAIELDSFSDDGIKFYTGADAARTKNVAITPTEQMRLDNSGRLGIGTTSPSQKLQVEGNVKLDNGSHITWSNTNSSDGRVKIEGDESLDRILLKVDNSNAKVINLTTSGVGIGSTTTPSYNLDVTGTGRFTGAVTLDSTLAFSNSTATDVLNLSNNNIYGVNNIKFSDPGPTEGLQWTNTKIYESPDDLTTNSAGNLQLVYNNTRRLTVNNTGIDVNGTITGATNIPKRAATTATGGTGTEDGPNTWAKLATYSNTQNYSDATFVYSVVTEEQSDGSGGIIHVKVRWQDISTSTNPLVSVEWGSKNSGTLLGVDAFKLINDGPSSDIELWVQKDITYGDVELWETAYNKEGAVTVTYETNSAWQSSTPTGTAINVTSSTLKFDGKEVIVGDNFTNVTDVTIDGRVTTDTLTLKKYGGDTITLTPDPAFSNAPSHGIVHTAYQTALGDYITLKSAGNSTYGHGVIGVADNGVYFGKTDVENSSHQMSNSATAPLDTTYGFINSSGLNTSKLAINTLTPHSGTRAQICAGSTSFSLNSTAISNTTLVLSNSDDDYGTVFATAGTGKGYIQQRRTATATYYDLSLQTYGGNLGIGTDAPTQYINTSSTYFRPDSSGKFLTINGDGNGAFIMLESTSNTNGDQIGGLYFTDGTGQSDAHRQVAGIDAVVSEHSTNDSLDGADLRFFTKPLGGGASDPRMTIRANGNIGINTSPSYKLDVNSGTGNTAARFVSTDATTNLMLQDNTGTTYFSSSAGNAYFGGSAGLHANNLTLVQSTGNVGIGDYTPNFKLHVNSGTTNVAATFESTDNEAWIQLRDDGAGAYGCLLGFDSDNNNLFKIADSSVDVKFSLKSSGRVGIGIEDPTEMLEVYTNGDRSVVRIHEDAGSDVARLHLRTGGNDTHIQNHPSTGFEIRTENNLVNADPALRIQGGGNATFGYDVKIKELGIDTTETSTSATTQVAIDSFAAATFRSARYTIQVTNSTDSTYHITEILLIHDGTTPQITEYGTIFTGSAEATFDADISSGNVRLLATPATTDSMTFKVVRHCITV